MFKWFTWSKFAGWCTIAAGFITGGTGLAIGSIVHISSTALGAIGSILVGISTLVTTSKAGTATTEDGTPVNKT